MLLQLQFGTSFKVLEQGSAKVTQGVWMQSRMVGQVKVLVLDVEGSGGIERRATPDLERQMGLFFFFFLGYMGLLALTAADIMVFNVNNLLIEHAETINLLQALLSLLSVLCLVCHSIQRCKARLHIHAEKCNTSVW